MSRSSSSLILLAVFLFVSDWTGTLHAYLDPGTGSMLLQGLLATVVGTFAVIRVYWSRIKALVLRRSATKNSLID